MIPDRLMFAWARGARIQVRQCDYEPYAWFITNDFGRHIDYAYRIHPDDAHLEYGPLSSALRDDVLYAPTDPQDLGPPNAFLDAAWGLFNEASTGAPYMPRHIEDGDVLFFCEHLADMGL